MEYDLDRFITAQEKTFSVALKEIRNGKKQTHWMWFIFPQLAGLGNSSMARQYALDGPGEAEAYLAHAVLGPRLVTISGALLGLETGNATAVMGTPDDVKLKSSMTLFSLLAEPEPVFEKVLEKFFEGERDDKTLLLLRK